MQHGIHPDLMKLATPIEALTHDPRNARRHSERNLKAIQSSLEEHGQRKPLVAQRPEGAAEDAVLIVRAGNGTMEAARRLGWTHVAVVVVEESDKDAEAFAVRDNRTAELAEWDSEALLNVLDDLEDQVSLMDLGFDDEELDAIAADLASEDMDLPDDEVGSTLSKTPAERREEWEQAGIRSVILPFSMTVYERVAAALKKGRKQFGVDSNAELVVAMLEQVGCPVEEA